MSWLRTVIAAGATLLASNANAGLLYSFSGPGTEMEFASEDFIAFSAFGRASLPVTFGRNDRRYEGAIFYEYASSCCAVRDERDKLTLLSYAGASVIIDDWYFPDGTFSRIGSEAAVEVPFFVPGSAIFTVAAVPGPDSLALMLGGLGLFGWALRRRSSASAN